MTTVFTNLHPTDTLHERDVVELFHVNLQKVEDVRVVSTLCGGDVFECIGVATERRTYLRKARARVARANGVYDIVTKNKNGRWVKVDGSSIAFMWGHHARRPIVVSASAESNK